MFCFVFVLFLSAIFVTTQFKLRFLKKKIKANKQTNKQTQNLNKTKKKNPKTQHCTVMDCTKLDASHSVLISIVFFFFFFVFVFLFFCFFVFLHKQRQSNTNKKQKTKNKKGNKTAMYSFISFFSPSNFSMTCFCVYFCFVLFCLL